MKRGTYETVTTVDEVGSRYGKSGKTLYRIPRTQILCLLLLLLYTAVVLGFSVFVLWRCPPQSRWSRVLPTGNWKVDQFYSGLTLSVLFTPAALLIRRLSNDVALLHPFALASKTPVAISDLDLLMDPGVTALGCLFRYSFLRASAQSLIMAVGAFLVPIGTLLVYPGTYSAPVFGRAAVGIPTAYTGMMTMSIVMEPTARIQRVDDFFLETATDVFVGNQISQMGVLRPLPSQLGPIATANLTYVEGVTYNGIVTYKWSSGCVATEAIQFTESTESSLWMFNVTMPDGSQCWDVDAWDSALCMSNATNSNQQLATVYYAIMGTQEEAINFDNVTSAINTGLTVSNGSWISRVACTPTLTWEVSNCDYHNGSMTNCVPAPGQNTTALDQPGLDQLSGYMSAVPLNVVNEDKWSFGFQTILIPLIFDSQATDSHQYRAPTIQDYDNMYGYIAQSIVKMITAGYYGVAEVPTTGSEPQVVYLVRLYILLIVAVLLILCPLAPLVMILRNVHVHKAPVRPATFLTIANAVRGPWWDRILWGTCLMNPSEARHALRGIKVMFGIPVDSEHMFVQNRHVGLSERVAPVQDGEYYFGVNDEVKSYEINSVVDVSD